MAILLKTTKPEAKKVTQEAQKYFLKRNYHVFTSLTKPILKKGLEWVLIFGGDGAMLNAANQVARYDIPIIGVNFGYKGYLCQIDKNDISKALGALHSKYFSIKSYTRLRAKIIRKTQIVKEVYALNEIVVGGINRAVWLKLNISYGNKTKSARVIGDGIIISTQIGSTAYNIFSGGPVLLTDVFSVVANNALFESDYFLPNTKAFVIPTNTRFEVRPLRYGDHLPYVVADGQRDHRLQKGDKVIIMRSPMVTKLIELKI
ncbi:NAD(+)/NADH kinase [Patescibacteria group bacterium AH-259-L07]|nr:NAD(+)/NADH kinase [Patescibacteria group bacterium AH-259-L07]